MAIGTSITPRGYNVDTTGRSYALDPDPLLNVAEKAFASQRESQRQVQQVALQGVALGEFIGARQQLGRVKAQLSDLDVNDPMFAQKYSAVVADNPLAFTNERLAPVTRAAVTPVLAAASQAMKNRAAMERAQVMAGYQAQAAAQRNQYQQGMVDYRNANPRPATPRQPGLGERLLFGDLTDSPQAATPAAPAAPAPTGSVPQADVPQLPTDGSDAYGGGLIPFGPDGAYADEGLVEGQGDGPVTVPPNIRNTALGPMRVKSVGEGATLEPVAEAVPARDVPPGYMDIPDQIIPETGTAASRKLVPLPEKSASALKEEEQAIETAISTDPQIASLIQNADLLTASYLGTKESLSSMSDTDKNAAAPQLASQAVAAAMATSAAKTAKEQARMSLLARTHPLAAQVEAQRQIERDAAAIQPQGTGEYGYDDILSSPPPRPAAQPLDVREQIVRRDQAPLMQAWTDEKSFAVSETEKIESTLGYTPGTILRTMASGDQKGVSTILDDAKRRGVQSPLLRSFTSQESLTGPKSTMAWARSKKLDRGYDDVLRAAAKERYPVKEGEETSPRGIKGLLRMVK